MKKKSKQKEKAKQLTEVSKWCLVPLSKLGKIIVDSTIDGGYYVGKGAEAAAKKGKIIVNQVVQKIGSLKAGGRVELKEYILKHKTPPNILVKIPFPQPPESSPPDKSYMLAQLGEVLSTAAAEEDENNLTILNLDDYFKNIEEEK